MTPEQNDERQQSRAAKREQARDARLVAEIAARLWLADRSDMVKADAVDLAVDFLNCARGRVLNCARERVS